MYLLIRTHPYISSVPKYYKNLPSCKTDVFHCLYISTMPVCSVANQVQVRDMHHLCVACVHWQLGTHQNCMQHVHAKFLSCTCGKRAGTCMY